MSPREKDINLPGLKAYVTNNIQIISNNANGVLPGFKQELEKSNYNRYVKPARQTR